MTQLAPVVCLLDVDNTRLDNDRIGANLKRHLTQAFGAERQERYLDYPFANRLFPGSLDVIERLRTWGPTIILSDGDVVLQPRKVERIGDLLPSDQAGRNKTASKPTVGEK